MAVCNGDGKNADTWINTLNDLRELFDHMDDKLSEEEESARESLIELCSDIHWDYGVRED